MRRLLSNLVLRVFSRFSNLLAANQETRVFSSLLPPYRDTRRPKVPCFLSTDKHEIEPTIAFLLFIVEHSGEKQKRKTRELIKGTLHVTCTFLYPPTEPILSVSTVYKA